MRIAPRLVLTSGIAVAAVMTAYGLISLHQRAALIGGAHVRETDMLASAVQAVAENALRDGRIADIDRVLARLAREPLTYAGAVVDAAGRTLAGGPADGVACVMSEYTGTAGAIGGEAHGWADCAGEVRWVALPVRSPGAALVLARHNTVVARDMAASRRRILITTLALAAIAAGGITLVLRRTISAPLAALMRGVRLLGGPSPPPRIRVTPSTGEVGELANAFNEMTERLEGKRATLVRETEERIALERKLRGAEKFAAIGRLTAGLAHQLGSPLNVVGVRAEAVAHDERLPRDARAQAERILDEIDRMTELVRGLTHVARRHPVDRRPVDLAELAVDLLRDLESVGTRDGIRTTLETSDAPVVVPGDPVLLRHALSNVTTNAVQALAGADGDRWIRVRVARGDGAGLVVVEDNGPGIPTDDMPHVLEPFFTTKEVGKGAGLGLAIALGIVEEHGGALDIGTRGDGGVRVSITLPLEPAPATMERPNR